MRRDIESERDIELLVDAFYRNVQQDKLLGPCFGHVNWDTHLPVMYAFWKNAIFYTGGYYGNPLSVHISLHAHFPLNEQHFTRWSDLFSMSVDELFEGSNAAQIKEKAANIITILRLKILNWVKE